MVIIAVVSLDLKNDMLFPKLPDGHLRQRIIYVATSWSMEGDLCQKSQFALCLFHFALYIMVVLFCFVHIPLCLMRVPFSFMVTKYWAVWPFQDGVQHTVVPRVFHRDCEGGGEGGVAVVAVSTTAPGAATHAPRLSSFRVYT